MEFLPPDFPQGHPQTPPHHLCSPSFHPLQLGHVSLLALYQVPTP